jgi:hypothetical protein
MLAHVRVQVRPVGLLEAISVLAVTQGQAISR